MVIKVTKKKIAHYSAYRKEKNIRLWGYNSAPWPAACYLRKMHPTHPVTSQAFSSPFKVYTDPLNFDFLCCKGEDLTWQTGKHEDVSPWVFRYSLVVVTAAAAVAVVTITGYTLKHFRHRYPKMLQETFRFKTKMVFALNYITCFRLYLSHGPACQIPLKKKRPKSEDMHGYCILIHPNFLILYTKLDKLFHFSGTQECKRAHYNFLAWISHSQVLVPQHWGDVKSHTVPFLYLPDRKRSHSHLPEPNPAAKTSQEIFPGKWLPTKPEKK